MHKSASILLSFILLLLSASGLGAQGGLRTEDYIALYKEVAISEMYRTGIPASITLAQGILESGSGNSRLAVEANNHFGIKCHEWNGDFIREDDDAANECFRKYEDAMQSYIDHSEFLMSRPRYAFLFEYSRTDYKHWAHGLKKAGYATNPKYAHILIDLIDRYDLHRFDTAADPQLVYQPGPLPDDPVASGKEKPRTEYPKGIFENNRVKYVILQPGASLASIAAAYEIRPGRLMRYNDLSDGREPVTGSFIYLQPKRKSGNRKKYRVKEEDDMYSISQKFAVRLGKLYERNKMQEGEEPLAGETIYLRGKRKSPPRLRSKEIQPGDPGQEAGSDLPLTQETPRIEADTAVDTITPQRRANLQDPYEDLKEEKGKYLYPAEEEPANEADVPVAGNKEADRPPVDKETWLYHTVEAGQTLYAISRMYEVKVEQIKKWNNLKDNTIKAGETLIVGMSE